MTPIKRQPVPRVAAVHDLSGVGRVALTVVIPVLSAMGIQVCPLPSAVLSSGGQYGDPYMVDLSEHLHPMIDHWKRLNMEFEGIYTGFLGSASQVDIVRRLIADFRREDQLVLVDPVMGDEGSRYGILPEEIVPGMRRLVCDADIITPNLTEACLLLDEEYSDTFSLQQIKEMLFRLGEMGPGVVILTSVPQQDPRSSRVLAWNRNSGRLWQTRCEILPGDYPGTGDTFASVILGGLLTGDSLPIALDRAVQFINQGVRATFGFSHDPRQGILLERILDMLRTSSPVASYELLEERV